VASQDNISFIRCKLARCNSLGQRREILHNPTLVTPVSKSELASVPFLASD